MTEIDDDFLWPHFKPLWSDLSGLGGGGIQIAGGYGLYLKQRWLSGNREQQIVIPLERWIDAAPRVTADFDLVLGLDLLPSLSSEAFELGWETGFR